jgi:hypothetical protein
MSLYDVYHQVLAMQANQLPPRGQVAAGVTIPDTHLSLHVAGDGRNRFHSSLLQMRSRRESTASENLTDYGPPR